ncbi:MAG TPA: Rpn family recombination-promoting nuclease/putative transposase, partial [Thermodesulfovibrionia bacterium]|nr:Rpn family recombination-promoting nuclease/putative transposase [Thermodesulfovibrionia bacterium]
IVVYHGKEKWSVGVNFQSLMKVPEAMRPFVPEFSCLLYDLGKYTDEEIKGAVILKVAILLMKHIFSKDLGEKLPEILGLLVEIMDKQTGLEYLQTILRYLSSAGEHLNKEEVREALTKTFVEQGGNLMATLAEQWIEEGRAEGKKEGRAEAQKMLIELLEFRFSFAPSYMVEMVEGIMSLEVLRQLRKRAFTVDSLEQFEAILRERVSC